MSTGIASLLTKLGLPATGAAIESDIASLLMSSTPEGWLAKGALAAVGGFGANQVLGSVLGGKKRKSSKRSKRSSRSRSRSRSKSSKRGSRYRSKAWMAKIRKMRK